MIQVADTNAAWNEIGAVVVMRSEIRDAPKAVAIVERQVRDAIRHRNEEDGTQSIGDLYYEDESVPAGTCTNINPKTGGMLNCPLHDFDHWHRVYAVKVAQA